MNLIRKAVVTLVAALAIAFAGAAPAIAAPHEGNPGGNCNSGLFKVETSDGSIVLAAGTVFCVKQENSNTGTLTADGTTTLAEYAEQAGLNPGVSNYVVYSTPEVTPSPTPSVAPSPSPTPSSSPTPSPSSTPSEEPECGLPEGCESPSPSVTPSPTETPSITLPPTDAKATPTNLPETPAADAIRIMLLFGAAWVGWRAVNRHLFRDQ